MKAEYIDHLGSDLTVVNAARVSFDKTSKFKEESFKYPKAAQEYAEMKRGVFSHIGCVVKYLDDKDQKLIKYLAEHGHWTPFGHPQITLREKVPIFVARQRFKHMVGFVYNEVSRRYVDDTPEFFIPEVWRERPLNGIKQGSGEGVVDTLELTEHLVWDDFTSPKLEIDAKQCYNTYLKSCEEYYKLLIENNVAPEQARMVLPQSMYTEYYVTGSLAAWARAYKLRSDTHAQQEIQVLAKQWDAVIRPLFPVSWSELTKP